MAHNIDSMAYYGEVPWHGLGKKVPMGVNAEEMIRTAGLDWEVEMRPARGAKLDRKKRASRYELIRIPRPDRKEEEILLGVVSSRYKSLQNKEAFSFFDPIVEGRDTYFETAGSLGQGDRIWVLAKMPGAIQVVRGDDCLKYLLLSNTHTGEGSVIVKFTTVRVVCDNTLMLSLKDGQKAYRVRHSKNMTDRLKEISELIAITKDIYEYAEQLFKQLVKVTLNNALLLDYLERVFPRTEKQNKQDRKPPRWTYIMELLESRPDLLLPGVKGTLWAAYNAITFFEDYKQIRPVEEGESRLDRIWFGNSAETKYKALQEAKELAKTA